MNFRKMAEELVSKMTVSEKLSQMKYNAPAIERLGIPAYNWWSECLHGAARNGTATVFPQVIGMAASFNKAALKKVGSVISDEIRAKYNENKMLEYRREKIGYIFQFYNLIQTLNAKDNVELVLELCKKKKSNSEYLLEQVGLKERMNNYPSQLSGGEQQRVSIARALAKEPRILFADEPTGALDYNTTRQVLELLVKTCKEKNITLIIVTHNNFITPIADVVYSFRSGEIISIERNQNPTPVGELPW